MHPNPVYRGTEAEKNLAFARARGFGALSMNGEESPLLSHIPFLLSDDGETAELHLLRSNPIARQTKEPQKAVLAVNGPDGYVSPDWYGAVDQVPTWNYVAVHLRGTLVPMEAEELHGVLNRLSAHFEAELLPKIPWTTEKMTPDVLTRMMRAIQPFRFLVEDVQGTWKLNQNKPEDVRLRAADGIETGRAGIELARLATLMRNAC